MGIAGLCRVPVSADDAPRSSLVPLPLAQQEVAAAQRPLSHRTGQGAWAACEPGWLHGGAGSCLGRSRSRNRSRNRIRSRSRGRNRSRSRRESPRLGRAEPGSAKPEERGCSSCGELGDPRAHSRAQPPCPCLGPPCARQHQGTGLCLGAPGAWCRCLSQSIWATPWLGTPAGAWHGLFCGHRPPWCWCWW